MANLHDYAVKDIEGKERALSDYAGKAVLIVNVASKCGLTPQYDGLVRLYDEYRSRGFEVLGFPCNQFMGQEPGSESEIQTFCSTQYGVDFPLFSKIEVNGDGRAPLYAWLTEATVGPAEAGDVKWNFEKFLIDAKGEVRARFAPPTEPCSPEVKEKIEAVLAD